MVNYVYISVCDKIAECMPSINYATPEVFLKVTLA